MTLCKILILSLLIALVGCGGGETSNSDASVSDTSAADTGGTQDTSLDGSSQDTTGPQDISSDVTVNKDATPSDVVAPDTSACPGTLQVSQELSNDQGVAPHWQSFVAPTTGWITRIEVLINAYNPPNGTDGALQIYDGEGVSTPAIHTQNFHAPNGGKDWVELELTAPIAVTKNQLYSWELTGVQGVYFSSANPYAAGTTSQQGLDYAFRVWIQECQD